MLELVTPAQRQEVLKVVLSVDELIGAELLLQEALNTQIGPGSAARFSKRREVSNILGPLSYDVDVISEEIAGDEATVLIQVAGRVPLEPVSLDRQGGAWVIDPGPPVPGLAAQLRRLAEATREVTAEVNGGGMTAQDVYAALSLRQRPALAEIARLLAASPAVAEQKRSGE